MDPHHYSNHEPTEDPAMRCTDCGARHSAYFEDGYCRSCHEARISRLNRHHGAPANFDSVEETRIDDFHPEEQDHIDLEEFFDLFRDTNGQDEDIE